MSHLLPRFYLLIILIAAGCAWQSETIYTPNAGNRAVEIGIEIDSSRSLSGTEHGTRYVFPNTNDSIQYIILNGKIVWAASPFYEDSLAPYYIDGQSNTVTMVWPQLSATDTESVVDSSFQILSPPPGDTIVRANGVTIKCAAVFQKFNTLIDLDDGTDTISFYLDTSRMITVADTSLMKLHGSMIRISLHDYSNFGEYSMDKSYSTFINATRSIQYPMK